MCDVWCVIWVWEGGYNGVKGLTHWVHRQLVPSHVRLCAMWLEKLFMWGPPADDSSCFTWSGWENFYSTVYANIHKAHYWRVRKNNTTKHSMAILLYTVYIRSARLGSYSTDLMYKYNVPQFDCLKIKVGKSLTWFQSILQSNICTLQTVHTVYYMISLVEQTMYKCDFCQPNMSWIPQWKDLIISCTVSSLTLILPGKIKVNFDLAAIFSTP